MSNTAKTTVGPERYAQIRALAERLKADGGGGSTEDYDMIQELNSTECQVLDSMALECAVCNQWFAANEMHDVNGEYVCTDCDRE